MPLYEYACKGCEHQFEALVRNGDAPVCPACGAATLERRMSVFAAHTNGGSADFVQAASGGCGHCGDPRGPGACSMN